jgi:hypothetical protein
MKKRALLILFVLLVASASLFASSFDLSLFWGPHVNDFKAPGVGLATGMNVGITKRTEASLWLGTELTPDLFTDNTLALEVNFALLGVRNTGTAVAGSGINMLLGAGIMATSHNAEKAFRPTDVYLSLTPLTIGNPMLERRERGAKMMLSYNWEEKKVGFMFDLLLFDYYLVK